MKKKILLGIVGILIVLVLVRVFVIGVHTASGSSMSPALNVGDYIYVSKLSYGITTPFSSKPSYLFRWSTPRPGDIVVFQAPDDLPRLAGQTWVQRVIAGSGQTVRLEETVVYVDEKPYKHVTPEANVRYMDFFRDGAGSFSIGASSEGVWVERDVVVTTEKIGDFEHSIYQNPAPQRFGFEANWPIATGQKAFMRDICNYEHRDGLVCDEKKCRVKDGYLFVMGDNRGLSSDSRCWGAVPVENVKGRVIFAD